MVDNCAPLGDQLRSWHMVSVNTMDMFVRLSDWKVTAAQSFTPWTRKVPSSASPPPTPGFPTTHDIIYGNLSSSPFILNITRCPGNPARRLKIPLHIKIPIFCFVALRIRNLVKIKTVSNSESCLPFCLLSNQVVLSKGGADISP